jgi:hypothetical protein
MLNLAPSLEYESAVSTAKLSESQNRFFILTLMCTVVPPALTLGIIVVARFWESDLIVLCGLFQFPIGVLLFLLGIIFFRRWVLIRRAIMRKTGIKMKWLLVMGILILLLLSVLSVFECAKWAANQIT